MEAIVFHRYDPAWGTGQGRLSWYPNSRKERGLIMGNDDRDTELTETSSFSDDPAQMTLPGFPPRVEEPTQPGLFEP